MKRSPIAPLAGKLSDRVGRRPILSLGTFLQGVGIEWLTIGDGFTWDSKNMDRTEAIARHAWTVSKEKIASGDYGLVVLDEITYPMNWGWIPTAEVVEVIKNRPPSLNIIATGRDAPAELVEVADTVTEMKKTKHAFDRGVRAIRGIDF